MKPARTLTAGAAAILPALCSALAATPAVVESARQVPVVRRADVVVVGGSSGAVAAAVAAAKAGAKVFLAAPRTYLGDDIAGTLHLWLDDGERPATDLARKVFAPSTRGKPVTEVTSPQAAPAPLITPMQAKATLDAAMLEAGAEFLFGCYVTDVLVDEVGKPAGIVMANRAGRQAVVAKFIIDATDRATAARRAGAQCSGQVGPRQTFRFVVVGGQVHKGEGIASAREIDAAGWAGPLVRMRGKGGQRGPAVRLIEYTLDLPLADDSFASLAAAEQRARDLTFDPGQLQTAEMLHWVPPTAVKCRRSPAGAWGGADKADLDAFRPAGVERLYVLGARADVPREVAEELMRPCELMALGERIGNEAAREAKALAAPKMVHVRASAEKQAGGDGRAPSGAGAQAFDVRETLVGLRAAAMQVETVPSPARELPVLGTYDVVVVGGGTSGAPAGIAAARRKSRTLVVEYQHGLGGVGTLGLIGKYYHGYRGGFTAEIDKGVAGLTAAPPEAAGGKRPSRAPASVECKMEWYRHELRKAGAEIWFGAIGCGAVVEAGKVRGVVVAGPTGRGVVLAGAVIDATGNADVAAAAGAACEFVSGPMLAMQGAGLPPRALGAAYTNTDYTFADEADMLDVWRLFVQARRQFRGSFDSGTLIDSRERRRIVGDCRVTICDILAGRTYADTVGISKSNYDTHGYTLDAIFLLRPPHRGDLTAWTPYRALLPRGLDGLLVVGLGMSAHRDAMPILRMQPDLQNQGFAAGLAAAAAARLDGQTRKIDVRAIQKTLAAAGCIPQEALTHQDNFPLPAERIAAAVQTAKSDYEGSEVILTHRQQALPLLRRAHAAATAPADRLAYAHILAVCGDATGAGELVAAVSGAAALDKGWNFRGMGQFGSSMSRLDALILALGCARDRRAVPALLDKLKGLDAASDFSHHRALAEALEMIGDPQAARPLAELLAKPGMTGHSLHGPGTTDRSKSLRELILARALYRLGDWQGVGEKVLRNYAGDVRGVYAGHAASVLRSGK